MAGYIDVKAAIEVGKQALREKAAVYEKIEIVRADLRNAVKLGGVSAEDKAWIEKNFPKRERKTKKTP